MSSDSDSNAAVAVFNLFYAGNYCTVAVFALFVYEALITFDREVACFWTTKRTGASRVLFFGNRWCTIAFYVMVLATFASFPSDTRLVYRLLARKIQRTGAIIDVHHSCSIFQRATLAVEILQVVPGAVFSALRAYVLSRSKALGVVVLALSLAPVGANLAQYDYQLSGENFPPFGCVPTNDVTAIVALRRRLTRHSMQRRDAHSRNGAVVLTARVPLIVADTLLIYITWTKLSSSSTLRDLRRSRLSLSDVLFRDGTIYFVVLFCLNVLHLVFTVTALEVEDKGQSYVSTFTAPITSILVSRFLLELQEADQMVIRLDPGDPLHSSQNPYDVPSFISSIGAFINPDFAAPSVDDSEFEWPLSSRLNGMEDQRAA